VLVCIGVVDVDGDALDMKRLALLAAVAAGLMVNPAAGARSELEDRLRGREEQRDGSGPPLPDADRLEPVRT
jgi:hypothetical protein